MKEGIHPDYHPITVVMTDGTRYETRSTWGKPGDVLQLDVDPKTHPAWVGGISFRKTGQMEKFNNKFSFLGTKDAAPKDAAPKEAAVKDATAKEATPKDAAPKEAAVKDAGVKDKASAKKETKKEDKKGA